MKKIYLATLAMFVVVCVQAQTVISNNYSSPISEDVVSNDYDEESVGLFNLSYYSFDGFNNFGIADYFINPNNIGGEFAIRAQFESHGNFNFDLGINYACQLTKKDDISAFLTLSIGPSLRLQDEPYFDEKTYKIKYDDNSLFIDAYINPRLTLKYKRVALSVGYFYWAPKWKFSKDDGAVGGLNLALGYSF